METERLNKCREKIDIDREGYIRIKRMGERETHEAKETHTNTNTHTQQRERENESFDEQERE